MPIIVLVFTMPPPTVERCASNHYQTSMALLAARSLHPMLLRRFTVEVFFFLGGDVPLGAVTFFYIARKYIFCLAFPPIFVRKKE